MKKQLKPLPTAIACAALIAIIMLITSQLAGMGQLTLSAPYSPLPAAKVTILNETSAAAGFTITPAATAEPADTSMQTVNAVCTPQNNTSTPYYNTETPLPTAIDNTPALKPTSKPTLAPTDKPTVKPTLTPKPTATSKPSSSPPPVISGNPSYSGISSYEKQMLEWVNNERTNAGLNPLSSSSKLTQIARLKSADMIENNYFSHTSPTYGTPYEMLRSFGVSFRRAGENLAYNGSLSAAFSAFMNSSGHRANILNSAYTQIGIGVVSNGKGLLYITQLFIG